ncbi:MAG: MurR/RpiR family transcriptional regulator [Microbacteriaceae bacterium]|nr:MurR/RpiR family transcriptional regulator [Microbacteriaceae bacterium]
MIAIKDEVFARMDQLSPAMKKVARVLLADYPSAGLATAASLAAVAGTSTPTVLRLVERLGMGSYPDFQKSLRDEITHRSTSPVSRASHGLHDRIETSALESAARERIALIERLFRSVPPTEFDKAVGLLAASPRHVLISGGYFSKQTAQTLALQLDQLIPNVSYTADPLGHDTLKYLHLRRDSVVIICDFRRYELASKKVSTMAKQQGATVIVITDEELSPCAEDADVVLPIPVGSIPFDSFAALVVLTECLVEAVFHRVGTKAIERMTQWENAVQIHRTFRLHSEPVD